MATPAKVTLDDVRAAAAALTDIIRPTRLIPSHALSDHLGREVLLKPENFQRTGSFKIRGAYNRMRLLSKEARGRGVLAASAGNHAQGVSLAAQFLGVPATICMPETTPAVKIQRTRIYGAEVELVRGDFEAATERCRALAEERGAAIIPTYDDPAVIAGQGTVGLEILEECPGADHIFVPVGGGGLAAGIAVAARALRPGVRVVGVQAEGCPSLLEALRGGEPTTVPKSTTFAEGIAVRRVGEVPFALLKEHLADAVAVSDDAIARAMVALMEKSKLVVEAAGAVGAAALLSGARVDGKGPVVVVISGGNADLNVIQRVIERGLMAEGRYVRITVKMPDRPGNLALVLAVVAAHGGNVVDVDHDRGGWRVSLGEVNASLLVELKEAGAGEEILAAVRSAGFDATLLGRDEYEKQARGGG